MERKTKPLGSAGTAEGTGDPEPPPGQRTGGRPQLLEGAGPPLGTSLTLVLIEDSSPYWSWCGVLQVSML
ncbi:hypothetical protein EYF80_048424 [Liparis tanakae]|uniref:Uncharacterized protein n=1 Tax=Liparis tanakae TaxID=230148 RepID=A0A4Z2FJK6_9TELE|nr:hypothetical protein EYF80_048424 [Liparis tanakae]